MGLKGSVNQRDRKQHAPKRCLRESNGVGFQTAEPGSPVAGGVGEDRKAGPIQTT